MANRLCPQDYVDMIMDYVNSNVQEYTLDDIYDYCIQHSTELDSGDEARISYLIGITLEPLLTEGFAVENDDAYRTIHTVDSDFIIEDRLLMPVFTKESIEALRSIGGSSSKQKVRVFERRIYDDKFTHAF